MVYWGSCDNFISSMEFKKTFVSCYFRTSKVWNKLCKFLCNVSICNEHLWCGLYLFLLENDELLVQETPRLYLETKDYYDNLEVKSESAIYLKWVFIVLVMNLQSKYMFFIMILDTFEIQMLS